MTVITAVLPNAHLVSWLCLFKNVPSNWNSQHVYTDNNSVFIMEKLSKCVVGGLKSLSKAVVCCE